MRSVYYVLAGVALCAVFAVSTGIFQNSFKSGKLNGADVLAVFVDNPDVPADPPAPPPPPPPPPSPPSPAPTPTPTPTPSSGGGGGGISPPVSTAATTQADSARKGDFTGDGKVDISDFSILAYWYKRPLTAAAIARGIDLNNDGKVTLADFSILAYYWNR